MIDKYSKIDKLPTDIFGLKYRPTLANHYENWNDDTDWPGGWLNPFPSPKDDVHFTELVGSAFRQWIGDKRENIKYILEIGVDKPTRIGEITSTQILVNNKIDEAVYLGVDMENRFHVTYMGDNMNFLLANSMDKEVVYKKMEEIGMPRIDFLFIDGYHSVNVAINDWTYTEKMPIGGRVALHDINWHPGPCTLYDAVDEKYFFKQKIGEYAADWGLGLFERIA